MATAWMKLVSDTWAKNKGTPGFEYKDAMKMAKGLYKPGAAAAAGTTGAATTTKKARKSRKSRKSKKSRKSRKSRKCKK